jgi:hypothetical protein
LAQNYLASDVFRRVAAAPKIPAGSTPGPAGELGLWSELRFGLRRPLGMLNGIIDKLLITESTEGVEIEIIDFKTNRIAPEEPEETTLPPQKTGQFSFDFDTPATGKRRASTSALQTTAQNYQLQMQAYALAVRELLPALAAGKIKVTLHFLEPNVEVHLADELLEASVCQEAIDEAMQRTIFSSDPANFPVKTAPHCRMCNFLRVCAAGKEFLSASEQPV